MPKIIPDIPVVFKERFPSNLNTFPYWGLFSKKEIEENKGKILMFAIDFGRNCSLSCPTCFRKESVVDEKGERRDLSYKELTDIIKEYRKLDLQTIQVCGAGEPFEDPRFLQFIMDMTEMDIGIGVFTKGHVLGSDELTKRYFSRKYGIESAQGLCDFLYNQKISIMMSFLSFDPEIQDGMVRKKGFSLLRDRALANLVEAGFNRYDPDSDAPTRLALVDAPVLKVTYSDAFEIYTYARKRNMYPVIAVPMVSGCKDSLIHIKNEDVTDQQKIDLWTRIYSWNIENGVQTLDGIMKDEVSCMPGSHPCNQVACGLYITSNGNVVGCTGFNDVIGNVRDESVDDIWKRSENYKRAGTFNCKCPPKDGITIPMGLYNQVLRNLEAKYGKP